MILISPILYHHSVIQIITISSGTNLNNISFDGVKLGDVSGDWDYTLDKTGSTDSVMSVYSICDSVNIGDTTHFYLLANKVPDVIGFQFTLEWDNYSLGF